VWTGEIEAADVREAIEKAVNELCKYATKADRMPMT